jgi:hypothetical protein
MSRHKVSRGNTSDLIGMFNKKSQIEAPPIGVFSKKSQIEGPPGGLFPKKNQIEAPSSGGSGLLSVNTGALGVSHKFRKTSAYVPTTTKIEDKVNKDDVKFRKSSAMVLMPTVTLTEDKNENRSLNVDDKLHEFKPLKNVSGLENGSTELPKLRSALKLSTVNAPKIQTTSETSTTSLDTNNNSNRRGSVGLGRSKSVCHKVKFEPPQVQVGATTTPNEGHGRPNTKSPFAKFQQMDSKQSQLSPDSRLTRQNSLPSLNERKVSAPPPTTPNSLPAPSGGGLRRPTVVARSPSSAKEVILSWVQERTNNNPNYPNLNVTNFSTSWNDGMAFCALIHYYYPEAFNYEELDPKNRRYNFDLAFRAAEHFADICPLLDVEDMVMFEKPDWKCVFTYVQTFFRRFRNGRDPPVPTKKLTLTPPHISTPAPTINLAKSIE